MAETPLRRSGVVTFPGSPTDADMVCAVLITRHPETGEYQSFIREARGYRPVPAGIGAMVALEAEILNTN